MAGDLQMVEKEIKANIKTLNKLARNWERTLARAQHTRIGGPAHPRRRGKNGNGRR
jgi:hypothetical protein